MTKIISTSIKKSDPSKEVINIVIIGHANSGKSTTIGHLLRKLQCIDNNIYQQAENAEKTNWETLIKICIYYGYIKKKRTRRRNINPN